MEKHQHFLRILHKGIVDGSEVNSRAHLTRDPMVEPSSARLKSTCTTIDEAALPARSVRFAFDAECEKDVGNSFFETHERARKECDLVVEGIIQQCKRNKKQFFDEAFYFDKQDNMYPDGTPGDSDVGEPSTCVRITELYPDNMLFADRLDPDCLPVQGALGDGYLVQSITALQIMKAVEDGSEHPLCRNFAKYDAEIGVYGVLFYIHGAWSWVVIDDLIPVQGYAKKPLFCSSTGKENWPLLLEKAYAKLHGNWDCLDGGWPKEAFVNITGGNAHTIHSRDISIQDFNAKYVDNPKIASIVTCSTEVLEVDQLAEHIDRDRGLYTGGMYTVIRCHVTADGHGFVRVRNHFGIDGEWTGPYSDGSKDYAKNVLHKMELKPEDKSDHGFWMKWADFVKHFPVPIVLEVPADNTQTDVFSMMTKSDTTPQQAFLLEAKGEKPVDVWLLLGQQNPKIANVNHEAVKHQPYARQKLNLYKLSKKPKKRSEFLGSVERILPTPFDFRCVGSVEKKVTLEPGIYGFAPEFSVPEGSDAMSVPFYIRVMREQYARVDVDHIFDDVINNTASSRTASPAPLGCSDDGAGRGAVGGGARGIRDLRKTKNGEAASNNNATLTFNGSGGFDKSIATAYELADPWKRGQIDRRMAEQAFAQLLMHSDIGLAFSSGAAEATPLDQDMFKNLVAKVLSGEQGVSSSPQPL